jgi:ATP-dependent DNA helicase DinG
VREVGAALPGGDEPRGASDLVRAATGLLRRVGAGLPGGGEERAGQLEMAAEVARAIAHGTHLVVQAGTGTGKSLAYLAPAAVSGKTVVVATATRALQDQLALKDLPLVAAAVGPRFRWAVLKGRANYLCRQRASELRDGSLQPALGALAGVSEDLEGPSPEPGRLAEQLRRILRWSTETDTGDRAELAFEPSPQAWAMVSVSPRECPGAFRCPSGNQCFAEAARDRAQAAEVIVVNTHLYGAHLAAGGEVLPPHEVVVFDEAHELEEVMTACLGVELAPGRFRALGAAARVLLPPEDGPVAAAVGEVADRMAERLVPEIGHRVWLSRDVGETQADLAALLILARSRLDELMVRLRAAERDPARDDHHAALTRTLSTAGHLADDLARLLAEGERDVLWVDGDRRSPLLRLSPVDVSDSLAQALWGSVGAVLTSATIPAGLEVRLGLEGARHLEVRSPFDFANHALLYVARHLPDRRRADAEPAVIDELGALIEAAGGRTLALFTSRRATEAAAQALAGRLRYRLYVQGELPKPRLLEAFAAEESSCLFATLGFWQGVDVPGRSLSLVTLDRLPFPRPGDPVADARRERAGDAAFLLVDLPRAATLLAQGVGRLIRGAQDRGVVAVLDSRLATARYRATLLAALPPMRRTTDRRVVEQFLSEALGPSSR